MERRKKLFPTYSWTWFSKNLFTLVSINQTALILYNFYGVRLKSFLFVSTEAFHPVEMGQT